jgi:hypothetical protein
LKPQPVAAEQGSLPQVVFVMGAARSGSTLLGVLLGQTDDVFYAGELCDWPERGGISSIERSRDFWDEIRDIVGAPEAETKRFKYLFEHPAGIGRGVAQRRLRTKYDHFSRALLHAVAQVSRCSTIVDSSHYPRRARALRRLLGPDQMRLVYLTRDRKAVARSFRASGDKDWLPFHLYLLNVRLLSWLTFLSHPRSHRVKLSYERLISDPTKTGEAALGRGLGPVDPNHLTVGPVFAGNRFLKTQTEIAVRPIGS